MPPGFETTIEGKANVNRSSSGKSPVVVMIVIAVGLGLIGVLFAITRKPGPNAASTVPGSESVAAAGVAAPPANGNCTPTHCPGAACDACTAANCTPNTDGCDYIDNVADKKLCERIYACFNDPANKCVTQGDSLRCWCGTNPTTCVTANEPPTQANGKCRDLVFEGGRSSDAPTIRHRFVDPVFPLGRAVNLTLCRGTFCATECNVP